MIVSILQLMGFPMAKPVHSRAVVEAPKGSVAKEYSEGQAAIEQAKTRSARSPELKATPKKSSKADAGKAKPVAKSEKPAAKAVVASVKSKSRVEEKKSGTVLKSVKTAPAVKEVKSVKPAKESKAVIDAKKTKDTKAVKVTQSPVKTVKQVVATPASKTPAAAPKKATVAEKPVVKTAVKAVVSRAAAAPEVKTGSPVFTALPASAAQAQKAGRPSSRLAQLTVPSMAQSVASTAAKASYSQSIPSTVIVPALPSSIKKDAKLANNWKTKPVAELTDAELLAMSDDDYMNEVQLAAFRLKLQGLRQAILNNAGETTEHLREDTSVVPDPADRATIEEEHALELRTRDRERKLLKKIEQSIARIDAGDYGYCDETGEPIGVGRLLARPTATLSLEAQQRRELKQKMFGD